MYILRNFERYIYVYTDIYTDICAYVCIRLDDYMCSIIITLLIHFFSLYKCDYVNCIKLTYLFLIYHSFGKIIYISAFISRAFLYCCSCLSLMYFSVDLFHDNDIKFVELRTYITSCVC